MHGTSGGLIAGGLFILPDFLVLLAVSLLYAGFGDTTLIAALFAGVAPAVLPVVVQAVQRVAKRALDSALLIGFAVAAFAAVFLFNIPFPFVVIAAGIAGLVGGHFRPDAFEHRTHDTEDPDAPAPLIADDALHGAPRSGRRSARVLAFGLAIWGVPIVVLAVWQGTNSTLFEQAVFFSITAMVTLGGAYAVLAYIGQRAVTTYGWLLPGEMATALALAETTPGPLIQLVQFVGFMGAFRNPGALDPWVAGLIATVVVVWVTYVPCFLWIFLGAPYIEGLRHNRRLTHALTGVTASVVGHRQPRRLLRAPHPPHRGPRRPRSRTPQDDRAGVVHARVASRHHRRRRHRPAVPVQGQRRPHGAHRRRRRRSPVLHHHLSRHHGNIRT
jgi:chromate transporter